MPTRSHPWPLLIVGLSLVCFAAAAGHHIALPGLDYDELLFVNAATGGASESFVERRLLGAPVMLMSYIGALKAYLFTPIFAVFGVSPASIRWPAILLSLASILVTYKLARLSFAPLVAAGAALLVGLDPVFAFLTRVDYGPIVLMMLLKLVALYCFYRALATGSSRLLWAVVAACALGTYDKLNFIWFVLALGLTALALFRPELIAMYRRDRARFLAPVVVLALLTGIFCVRFIAPLFLASQAASTSIVARVPVLLSAYARTMDGREVYQWMAETPLASPTLVNYATIAVVPLLCLGWLRRLRTARRVPRLDLTDRFVLGYALLFLLIAAQIVITERAGAPHHMMVLHPFHLLLLTAGLAQLATISRAGLAAALLLGGIVAASEISVSRAYARALESESRVRLRLSPVIYRLAEFLDRQDADRINFVDWGIHNQVYALGRGPTRAACRDLWLPFREPLSPRRSAELLQHEFPPRRVLVVMHAPGGDSGVGSQVPFRAWASSVGLTLHPVRSFVDRAGRVVYEIYSVSRGEEAASSSTY
jgi:4-amino-4-deoxy-L-arabinose transferase-like glycosyltransferase